MRTAAGRTALAAHGPSLRPFLSLRSGQGTLPVNRVPSLAAGWPTTKAPTVAGPPAPTYRQALGSRALF